MYKLHLIIKYLRKRIIAWWSLLAVTLCTTMVLVVISVMGGWLNMFEHSFQGLTGDIVVESRILSGFPWYEEMIDRIDRQPGIEAAVPAIQTYGIVNIGNLKSLGVKVMGIPLDRIGRVNRFPESLWRQYNQFLDAARHTDDPKAKQALIAQANEHLAHPSFNLPFASDPDVYRKNPNLSQVKGADPARYPGVICGSSILEIHRNSAGQTVGRDASLYMLPVKVTTIAIHPGELRVDEKNKSEEMYWVVDDSHTGLWQYDSSYVYVPFDVLQKDLQMTAEETENVETGEKVEQPARTTEIDVRVKPGYDLDKAKQEVQQVVQEVMTANEARTHTFYSMPDTQTWREKQRIWIDAISNEKLLTVILFGIISIVAVFLVFCIFYMIVMEKTRDIGIIKSVGATSAGVAGIFLGYGFAIGLAGSLLGLLCSYGIVHYINELHAMLGRFFNVQIWNPEVYLFDKIPNTMSPRDIAIIVPIAIVASVLGALLPALRAARMHPVESLRWE